MEKLVKKYIKEKQRKEIKKIENKK